VEDIIIGAELKGYLLKRELEHSRMELELMGAAALESMLKRDYITVGRFVERWGREHEDVVSLKAITPNGFVLAEYKRKGAIVDRVFELERKVSHEGKELVILRLVGDRQAIERIVDGMMAKLIAGSVLFMSCLGAALWISQKKTALAPLEREIRLREEAEHKLREAQEGLEREVEERTEDLKHELAERRRAETRVLERDKEITLLLDSMAEAIYGIDTEGNCTFCNPSCLGMLGYTESDDLIGKNMHDIMHHTHADGSPYPRDECRICDAYRQGKGVHVDNEILWRADGTSFPVEYRSYPIISDEGVIGAVVTFLDITKRRSAEQEKENLIGTLNALVEHMPEGVFLLDVSGRVAMANSVGREHLEAVSGAGVGDRLDSLAGRSPGDLLISPPQLLWHDIEDKGRTFEVAGRSLRDGGMVFVMRDVTRTRELDKRLRLQERMAAVGQLAAGIAHDFNNILTVINGYTEMLLAEKGLDKEILKALGFINQSGERAANLIHQILDFSRQTVSEKNAIDLGEFFSDFLGFIKRTIPETIDISFEAVDGPCTVEADATKLQQVFANLVVNARDAMPEGGRLGIKVSLMDSADKDGGGSVVEVPGKSWVLVEVSDTGAGIPEEILPYIFEPFYTTKGPGHGTGLGLPQVYGLVKQHGGSINVETSSEGTAFQVYLPLVSERASEAGFEDTEDDLPKGNGQTVLVAEDAEDVRAMVKNLLTSLGYNVITAVNGQDALERFEASGRRVNLVLTDIVMPELDGFDLARELAKRAPDLNVIAISGYTVGMSEEKLRNASFKEMIKKPFKVRDLADAVNRHLHETEG